MLRARVRTSSTSTCPLCREDLARALGLECGTCAAIVHASCAAELGSCHPDSLLLLADDLAAGSKLADLGAEEVGSRAEDVLGFVGLAVLAVAIAGSLLQWGLGGAQLTLVAGGLALGAFSMGTSGLLRGRVELTVWTFSCSREPLAYLGSLLVWTALGLALSAVAAAPLMIPGPS